MSLTILKELSGCSLQDRGPPPLKGQKETPTGKPDCLMVRLLPLSFCHLCTRTREECVVLVQTPAGSVFACTFLGLLCFRIDSVNAFKRVPTFFSMHKATLSLCVVVFPCVVIRCRVNMYLCGVCGVLGLGSDEIRSCVDFCGVSRALPLWSLVCWTLWSVRKWTSSSSSTVVEPRLRFPVAPHMWCGVLNPALPKSRRLRRLELP